MTKNVIAVDLDGSLARHQPGQEEIGEPVPAMMERVRQWVKDGKEVHIFTARLGMTGEFPKVKAWLRKHGLEKLPVTDKKRPEFSEMWDDRAVALEPNTGRILGGHSDHDKSWEDGARESVK